MLISRWPIVRSTLLRYRQAAGLEKVLAQKSHLEVTVQIPGLGLMTLINLHTTAGGGVDPENPGTDTVRADEILQGLQAARAASTRGEAACFIGDLNAGPEASPENYQMILDAGFRDVYLEAEGSGRLQAGPKFTWDPDNFLNTIGPHSHCPGQRCDHLFWPATSSPEGQGASRIGSWEVGAAQVLFADQCVELCSGQLSTMSDHHGVIFEMRAPISENLRP